MLSVRISIWAQGRWLICLKSYRLLRSYHAQTQYWKDFDPFLKQKNKALKDSSNSIVRKSRALNMFVPNISYSARACNEHARNRKRERYNKVWRHQAGGVLQANDPNEPVVIYHAFQSLQEAHSKIGEMLLYRNFLPKRRTYLIQWFNLGSVSPHTHDGGWYQETSDCWRRSSGRKAWIHSQGWPRCGLEIF